MGRPQHPKALGDRSAAFVLAHLVEVYGSVLIPFGENHRYDLVVEERGSFLRVQCKTGRLQDGAVRFPTCSSYYHHPDIAAGGPRAGHRPYAGEIDLFGVYCPDNGRVYLVPVTEVGDRQGSLRVSPPRNGQSKKIRWAAEFEVPAPG